MDSMEEGVVTFSGRLALDFTTYTANKIRRISPTNAETGITNDGCFDLDCLDDLEVFFDFFFEVAFFAI